MFELPPRIVEFHNVYRDHGHRSNQALRVWTRLCDDIEDVVGTYQAHRDMMAIHEAYRAEQDAVLNGHSVEEVTDLVKARQAAWADVASTMTADEAGNSGTRGEG
jgi:hypothetical protein